MEVVKSKEKVEECFFIQVLGDLKRDKKKKTFFALFSSQMTGL